MNTTISSTTASADAMGQFQFFAPSTNPLIGLTVQPDDACRCGEQVAVLKTGKPRHAAALVCIGCGGFRGWLPNQAASFIETFIHQYGRPTEAIAYRRGPSNASTEGNSEMKKFEMPVNKGSLFTNDKKQSETDPDYKGSINFQGQEFWLNGWKKTAKSGQKFLSLSVRPKDEARTTNERAHPFNDSIDL